ncbi:TMEM175 family protein [Mucilaginibacter koreensis]
MKTSRLEAFSDGVFAIIITIMVLELKVPHGDQLRDLLPVLPRFLSYILSFVYVGIYWNNHHHMIYTVDRISGMVLWANLNLLFWLSLVPFVTDWMGEHHFAQWPVILYGFILLMCGVAYAVLAQLLMRNAGKEAIITRAFGNDSKGKLSVLAYIIAIGLAFISTAASMVVYGLVAVMWFVPDRRVERILYPDEMRKHR